ncbi:type II toxin-antitoxin system RelE/ParE family toxin [Holosporaceae bacterium 'Namur']|nr:type II toxin-antitoxin system RelE/ParE family toxin [Holosporaceae bacterium 'Namur']
MIKSFAHKGLKRFFERGEGSGIQPNHQKKIRLILGVLNEANSIADVNFPGSNLHRLKGDLKSCWSVTVNGNWRITFYFENGDAYVVNYQDYH